MSDKISLKPEEFLLREGEESTTMYFLQSGTLAVLKRQGDVEKQIGTIYSGEVVGEMSFLDKQPRSASIKAMTDSELVVIPSEKFEKIFKDQPTWYKALINTLLERLRKANARVRV
ncbi:MAG: cyclic nucleotide-binding domain-containing protein [Bacteriovoracaceae bacterium]|nr:cyclic nucleotide-binding domain-containing protein [Bacteriovoracaceae bacterium]